MYVEHQDATSLFVKHSTHRSNSISIWPDLHSKALNSPMKMYSVPLVISTQPSISHLLPQPTTRP